VTTFTPGTQLGRYEIRSRLGAGGMGDVKSSRAVEPDDSGSQA
jgi:hypothetical protein